MTPICLVSLSSRALIACVNLLSDLLISLTSAIQFITSNHYHSFIFIVLVIMVSGTTVCLCFNCWAANRGKALEPHSMFVNSTVPKTHSYKCISEGKPQVFKKMSRKMTVADQFYPEGKHCVLRKSSGSGCIRPMIEQHVPWMYEGWCS